MKLLLCQTVWCSVACVRSPHAVCLLIHVSVCAGRTSQGFHHTVLSALGVERNVCNAEGA